MRQFFTLLFLVLFSAGATTLVAQQPCPPGQPGGPTCQIGQQCVYCNLDGMLDENYPPIIPPQTIENCIFGTPPITLNNPRWYKFIAGTAFIQFSIKSLGCGTGSGLEAAITNTVCEHPIKAISCTTLDPANPVIDAFPLVVGNTYFLIIDGVNGAECKYGIEVSGGSATAPELGNLSDIQGLTQVCPKATTTYSISPVEFALTYTWTAPPGSKINGGGNVAILPPATGTSIQVQFGSLGGTLCVTASNACDTPKIKCITIQNTALAVNILQEETLCFEQLPFIWPESPNTAIFAPGKYTLTSTPYKSYLGCDSVVRQTITALPRKFKNLPTKFLCRDECFVVGNGQYCDAGTYQEILIASNGCDSTVTFTLVEVVVNAEAQVSDTITCKKPTVLLTGEGSSTGNTIFYRWINASGQIISHADTAVVSSPGEYSLIVSRFIAGVPCEDTATVTVIANTTLPVANAGPNRVLNCEEPSIQLQGSGSTGSQYTYLWLAFNGGNIVSGANTLTPTINAPGTYRLRVTNEINGCTQTDNTIVTADDLQPTLGVIGGTYTCSNPNVTLQAASNATDPTYSWSGPNGFTSAEQNPVVSLFGNYTVTVTDENTGCINVSTAVVIADDEPPGAFAPNDTLNCIINSVTLNGSSTAANTTFNWAGPNGFVSALPNPSVAEPGDYVLTVTGQNGCTSSTTATVTLDNAAPGATATGGTLTCVVASVTLNGSTPAANPVFAWTGPNGFTSDQPSPAAGTAGDYLLTVTGENGCTSTATATVGLNNNAPGATLAVSGTLGCDNIPVNINATSTAPPALLSHLWTLPDGSTVPTNAVAQLPASNPGNYSVVITNTSNGCTSTASATVAQTPAVTAAITSTSGATCFGATNGSATASGGGGNGTYTYLWNNDNNTPNLGNVGAGVYTVTITDGQLCTATATATISQPSAVAANATATAESVNNANDGTATANPSGGTAPYTFLWSNDETTATIDSLPDGFYTVTITDANSCTAVQTVQVIAGACGLTSSFQVEAPACNGDSTGSATIVIAGGTAPFTYVWSSGGTEVTEDSLAAGTYTVSVTDANGCDLSDAVEISEPELLTITLDNVANTECNVPSGSATVITGGGTGTISVLWSNDQTGPTASGLLPGTFTAVATDANGCTASVEATVTGTDNTAPVIAYTPVTAPLGTTGVVTLTVQSLGLNVTDACGLVSEVTLVPTSFNCTQLGAQSVAVTATDDSGNSTTENITVTVVDNEQPTLACPPGVTRCFGNNVVQYPAPVATDNCLGNGGIFNLVSGLPSGVPYPVGTTTNTYTYTDAGGNVGSCSFNVTILTPLTIALDTIINDIDYQGIGGINITVSGSLAPYAYTWIYNGDTLPVTTEDLSKLDTGIYQVFVVDNNGCSAASEAFTVSNTVDTDEPAWATGLLIVPNPTSGRLSVIFPEPMNGDVYLTVYDATGRLVQQQMSASPKRTDMDLSALADGLYALQVQVNTQVLVRKIVLSK